MDTKPYVIGNEVNFIREGDTLEAATTASRTNAPAVDDSSWLSFGIVDVADITPILETRDVNAPSPGGQKVPYDMIPTKKGREFKFTCEEISPLAHEFMYDTDAALTGSSTTYAILGSKNDKGWLQIKQYDQDDALFNTVMVYVFLQFDGTMNFDSEPKPVFKATVLKATGNTGTLVASA